MGAGTVVVVVLEEGAVVVVDPGAEVVEDVPGAAVVELLATCDAAVLDVLAAPSDLDVLDVLEAEAASEGVEVTAVLAGCGRNSMSTTSATIARPAIGNDPRGRTERCMCVASFLTGSPPSGSATSL